jgi:hypothetical protein
LYLLQKICSQHQDLCILPEALNRSKISYSFLEVFGGGHDFEDVKGGPGHIVTKHFKIYKLQESSGLEV